ncbi:MAG: hypothetical protein A3G18_13410 [Rhodospirillales bacterium RIFCSPLOWO2_12_FULL_58_28]|nr:MAG: hypothetical protein A3H92_13265 [Rhodospirillales bacterium RIFCSPLOWO2_02_FULL_58_16]OHC78571.1 MAG: hypothetical protein A3G18_13410 [Rhodospirillales bacterium RIFCSPLOWO2_12_FULL_58_28]
MAQESFEIYAFKDGNWSIDSVHDKKNLAVSLAVTLLSKTDKTAVRVVQKTGNGLNGQVKAVIIFKESSEDISISDKAWEDSIRKKKEARLKKAAEEAAGKAMEKKMAVIRATREKTRKFYIKIFKIIIIIGVVSGVLMGGIYYMLDYLGKL